MRIGFEAPSRHTVVLVDAWIILILFLVEAKAFNLRFDFLLLVDSHFTDAKLI